MRNILLVLIAVAALAACKERKATPEPRPDYDATHRASEKAHRSLGSETGGE